MFAFLILDEVTTLERYLSNVNLNSGCDLSNSITLGMNKALFLKSFITFKEMPFFRASFDTPSTKVFHYQQTPFYWDPLDTDTDDKSESFGYGSYSLFDRNNGDSTIFYVIRAGHKN